jgi:prophage antirepressor-like protein
MTNALTFESTTFDISTINNQIWLNGTQIGEALGYSDAAKSISKIYERNADEFTPSMTQLIELDTAGGKQQVRVFSLRGAHLLGMFARTEKAKLYRIWVLDILDKETGRSECKRPTAPYLILG